MLQTFINFSLKKSDQSLPIYWLFILYEYLKQWIVLAYVHSLTSQIIIQNNNYFNNISTRLIWVYTVWPRGSKAFYLTVVVIGALRVKVTYVHFSYCVRLTWELK